MTEMTLDVHFVASNGFEAKTKVFVSIDDYDINDWAWKPIEFMGKKVRSEDRGNRVITALKHNMSQEELDKQVLQAIQEQLEKIKDQLV